MADAARRDGAVAAINAGFFLLDTGDPTGALRVDGRLLSDAKLLRGAVAIGSGGRDGLRLTFDRIRVRVALDVRDGRNWRDVPLDGVDTVRRAGGATLYTPRFGPDTGTAAAGVEWSMTFARDATTTHATVASATRVMTGAITAHVVGGKTGIPQDGAVVSFGGTSPPPSLAGLRPGARVRVREIWESESPPQAARFARADDVVGGAGLLVRDGRAIDDWKVERTSQSLLAGRHPRTMIGTDARGTIWLVTIDGRQPNYSVGLTIVELRDLAVGLGLTNALNLDGGGSTTMVAGGEIVNRPSDPTGPRAVSDVLLVRPRPGQPPAGRR